eukprot:scaffold7932_cov410-Pinguiococcus_pyrenoidosus.AAC.3
MYVLGESRESVLGLRGLAQRGVAHGFRSAVHDRRTCLSITNACSNKDVRATFWKAASDERHKRKDSGRQRQTVKPAPDCEASARLRSQRETTVLAD